MLLLNIDNFFPKITQNVNAHPADREGYSNSDTFYYKIYYVILILIF